MTERKALEYIAFIETALARAKQRKEVLYYQMLRVDRFGQEYVVGDEAQVALWRELTWLIDRIRQQLAKAKAQMRAARHEARAHRLAQHTGIRASKERQPQKDLSPARRAAEAEPLRIWQRPSMVSDSAIPPELPLPVTPLRAGGDVHYFPDEIERRARAMEYWTPWGKRRTRSSRRYEGFYGQGR